MAAASRVDVAAYLDRLRLPGPGEPTIESLRRLHSAHVETVPYENLEIQLGRPTTVDPVESAERIVRGRGGYCYHLNGAFSALLAALGFQVTRHVGGVQRTPEGPAGATAAHMAVTVDGLPDDACPGGVWLVDVGLGAALHEPLPLHEGVYRQGPFEFGVRRSDAVPGGWRLDNDPKGSFVGMDFRAEPAAIAEFAAMHEQLSTSPESPFVRVSVVQLRDPGGADVLRGLVLTRLGTDSTPGRVLRTPAEWYEVLAERFGLTLEDVDGEERERLWTRLLAGHREYVRSG
jgi:N-hydroxyarylamine O-acetyltransferase